MTALDSTFIPVAGKAQAGHVGFLPTMRGAGDCGSVKQAGASPQCSPAAEQTHTTISVSPGSTATWRILVSIHLGEFSPPASDLLAQPSSRGAPIVAYRELRWPRCQNGTKALGSACLQRTSESALPNIQSGEQFAAFPAPAPWRMFTLYPSLEGWIFLGEVDKIVSVSPARFTSVTTEASCITFTMEVDDGEVVHVGTVTPDGMYLERDVHHGPEGRICQ